MKNKEFYSKPFGVIWWGMKILTVYCPLGFFFIFGFNLVLRTFGNENIDTTQLTNAGFAIFAGCASICFSWSKTFSEPNSLFVTDCGERCFLASILFIFASLLKYIFLQQKKEIFALFKFLQQPLLIIFSLFFVLAFFNALSALFYLSEFLFNKLIPKRHSEDGVN